MHTTTVQVRWGELDPYNHVNHAVYSSYLEHARVDALAALDTGMEALSDAGLQIVVVRSDVRFKAPATAGDELTVTSAIADMRGATITWIQHIERAGEQIVSAEVTSACVGRDGRPVRTPAALRDALSALRVA